MDPTGLAPCGSAWMWSVPIIMLTVIIHAFGLGFADARVVKVLKNNGKRRLPQRLSVAIMGGTAVFAVILHGFEASVWASAYVLLGAVEGRRSAMLYSVSAMTTYGHSDIHLGAKWQMMGALEALNGWILFGLTTAFLFTIMQKVWPHMDHPD